MSSWPILLNTGRVRDQWHTMTRTGSSPRLMAHQREPLLDIHPADAARLHLVDGALARIESPHGATVLPVRLSDDQRPGEVFAPMHWTDRFTSAGPIDAGSSAAATDPISGQPELKATPVRIAPVRRSGTACCCAGPSTSPHGPVLLGASAAGTRARFHAHRLGALPSRPRHRILDHGASRCAAGERSW